MKKEEIREILIDFLDSIRDYERESNNLIGHDERESIEFVDIYLAQSLTEQEQPKQSVVSDEEIETWAKSLESNESDLPETLKIHIQKKIKCRIEGAKWMRNKLNKSE